MLQSPVFPGCSHILYNKTQSLKAFFPAVPLSLFIRGSPRAKQGALYSRRLYVGAPCADGARLQTGTNQIQPVQVLY